MRVRVVLVGIEGSVNLGFIARTCMNFAVDELYLVNPSADLSEALRYAAKARDYLKRAVVVDSIDDAVKGVDLVVATTSKGYSVGDMLRQSIPLRDFIEGIKGRVDSLAILFGRESTGLTREELGKADLLVTIPANPEYPVLNVSQAVAIVLWELWNIKGFKAENIPPRAGRGDIERVLEIIRIITYRLFSDQGKRNRLLEAWRKIVWRSMPSRDEIRLLEYWFRRALNRITRGG